MLRYCPHRALYFIGALILLTTPSARAEDRWYGFGAGAGLELAPTASVGGFAIASAAMNGSDEDSPQLLSLRGTLAGFIAKESWALMPLLSGDAGLRFGPVDIFLTGGVQIFGAARREKWTVFATFGVLGGGGIALTIGKDLRLSLRAMVIWLPSQTTAKIEAPDDLSKPTFLLGGGFLSLEFLRPFRGD